MSYKMNHFIHEWENFINCFYYSTIVERSYKIIQHKETLDSFM